jgi:hypothetical protein
MQTGRYGVAIVTRSRKSLSTSTHRLVTTRHSHGIRSVAASLFADAPIGNSLREGRPIHRSIQDAQAQTTCP